MTRIEPLLDAADAGLEAALERLNELLRIPSISTDPAYADDCDAAADWLVAQLQSLGAAAGKHPTCGHPVVLAHADGPGPHLLFYGHYDVQPVDPLELWESDPFDPQIVEGPRGRMIRARGAVDDKGQLMTFIEACRVFVEATGAWPCRVTFLLEGEEESGSPNLDAFVAGHADELRADLSAICDTGLYDDEMPAIVTQLRGMLMEEVTIRAARQDLHSGMYGSLAGNPIHVLTRILAGLHDDKGRVTLPGFYDQVPELPDAIRTEWDKLGFDGADFLAQAGLSQPAGEADRTPLEMIWSRPTAEVNGVWGGYAGQGFKTVLPAKAGAKISFRLVGQQDPAEISRAFRAYVTSALPADMSAEFGFGKGEPAAVMDVSDPAFAVAHKALGKEWGRPAAFIGVGGSIPIAGILQSRLGLDSMLIGFGRSDDNMHSPNEKYDVECFHKGIRSWVRILAGLGDRA